MHVSKEHGTIGVQYIYIYFVILKGYDALYPCVYSDFKIKVFK